ncbi:Proline-specific permease [Fusarium oxysporum f. sp. albedinis]|nr:Proline-specific permease [Fusarium oxysporum f. sp. albedinis]
MLCQETHYTTSKTSPTEEPTSSDVARTINRRIKAVVGVMQLRSTTKGGFSSGMLSISPLTQCSLYPRHPGALSDFLTLRSLGFCGPERTLHSADSAEG